jgi:fumarate hydratase class II
LTLIYNTIKHGRDTVATKRAKYGQTDLQDAVPETAGQDISGYVHKILINIECLKTCQTHLCKLAIDDTRATTNIDTQGHFGKSAAKTLKDLTGCSFIHVPNKFEEINTYNVMMDLSGALNTLSSEKCEIFQRIPKKGIPYF